MLPKPNNGKYPHNGPNDSANGYKSSKSTHHPNPISVPHHVVSVTILCGCDDWHTQGYSKNCI